MPNEPEPRRGLRVGAEVSFDGARGRFTIKRIDDDIVTAWGGPTGREMMRSFTADRVKTVHYRKPRRR